MNKFRRSPLQRFQIWLNKVQRTIAGLLAPKWLRNLGRSFSKGLRKAEVTVSKTSQQVSKSMAQSAVGVGAKKIARGGKLLEFRFTKFLVEGAKFAGTLLAGLVPAPLRRLVQWFGRELWRIFGVFFVFVGRWFKTRRYWQLLGGIPAFLLALPLAYCMVRMPFYGQDKKAVHYRRAAQAALNDKDYATADLYYRKLQQLGAMNEVAEFQSAINMLESGREAEGMATIHRLAPADQPGFPPAHLWLARHYLQEPIHPDPEQNRAVVRKHIDHALFRDPDNPDARAIRASYLQQIGKVDEALDELRQVVKQIPTQGLSLADLYARQGRWQAARAEVDKVLKIYEEKSAKEADMIDYDYQVWSYCYVFLGNNQKAEDILLAGRERFPDSKSLTDVLYELHVRGASADFRARRGLPQAPAERLRRAAALKPEERDPLVMLADMARSTDSFGTEARRVIDEMLAAPDASTILCAVVGSTKAAENDCAAAIPLLRRAIEADPRDSYSLNNLAHCLTNGTTPNHTEALEFVNRALEIEPNELTYRETRGQILLRLGKHAEAIQDLEVALNGLGDSPELHAALATAYEALGQKEQAAAHRQQSL